MYSNIVLEVGLMVIWLNILDNNTASAEKIDPLMSKC